MNRKPLKYIALLALAIGGLTSLWLSRHSTPTLRACEGVVWTTEYHITYRSAADLTDSVQAVLQRVDSSASVYNKASLISAINRNESRPADGCLTHLLTLAKRVHAESGGAYDPTVMPLVNAWGFGYKNGVLPTPHQVDSILAFVGLGKVSMADGQIQKTDPRVQLDFSSIAKGFACDEIGRMLQRNYVTDYIIEIGGEVVAHGLNGQQKVWRVSVDMPTVQNSATVHDAAMILELTDGAVATSGSYRKWKETSGNRISHIVNPHTGRSETSDLLSATIIAANCATADAWATACMVLGTRATRQMLGTRSDLGVMTISQDSLGRLVVWSNERFANAVIP